MITCANPAAQYESKRDEIDAAIARVLSNNRYILGPEVEALEHEFAQYIGTTHGVGVANGTDAIELALRALGIGAGDEVITVAHTAVATVAAIEAAGAVPVLVDVDSVYYTMNASQIEEVVTSRTRAVIAVHLYGQAADLDAIAAVCTRHSLVMIEDGSQAHGSTWDGRKLGSIGEVGCFSCYPTKNLGALGDAGLITTSDAGLATKIRMLREYGWARRCVSDVPGRNSRLDELQAAILRVKLRHLDADNARRQRLAARYSCLLENTALRTPATRQRSSHVFHLYVIRTCERERVATRLSESNVYAGIHYPVPIHRQPAYEKRIRTAATMQETESLAEEVLSLPLYPELAVTDVEAIASLLIDGGFR